MLNKHNKIKANYLDKSVDGNYLNVNANEENNFSPIWIMVVITLILAVISIISTK